MTYRKQLCVEFCHVDPAGIVFYPRYFEMINSLVETFFRDRLDTPFGPMHLVDKMGVPTARFEVDFHAPSKLDDRLDLTLRIARVGRSSLDLNINISAGGQNRLTAKQTIVYFDQNTGKSSPWPDDIRDKLLEEIE